MATLSVTTKGKKNLVDRKDLPETKISPPEDETNRSGIESGKFKRKNVRVIAAVVVPVTVAIVITVIAVIVIQLISDKNSVQNLVEINLGEGEVLTYRAYQKMTMMGNKVEENKVLSDIEVKVLEKSKTQYWLTVKVNATDSGNQTGLTTQEPFCVLLTSGSVASTNQSEDHFELQGDSKTDQEYLRYVYSLLEQILPKFRKDLYEKIDGVEQTPQGRKPERSVLLPGEAKMHREAETQRQMLKVKRQFTDKDFSKANKDLDLRIVFGENSEINKTDGMVSHSRMVISEKLDFGEGIYSKDETPLTSMNVTLISDVVLIKRRKDSYGGSMNICALKGYKKLVPKFPKLNLKVVKSTVKVPLAANNTFRQVFHFVFTCTYLNQSLFLFFCFSGQGS